MKIGIYQNAPRHTEIMGTFLEYCIKNGFEIHLYTNMSQDIYSFIPYYQNLFGCKFYNHTPIDIVDDIPKLDYIIANTNSDILPKCFESDESISHKIIYVSHQNYHNKSFMKNHIIVSPNIKSEAYSKNKTSFILPIYGSFRDYNLKIKKNIYAIVGALREHGHDREIRHLIKLANKYKDRNDFKIMMFMRKDDFMRFKSRCPSLIENKLFDFKIGLDTQQMMNLLQCVKFLLPLARKGGWFHTQRLTGTIPLSLNMNVPLICDHILNDIYKLEGNVIYDFDDNDDNFLRIFDSTLNMPEKEYENLVKKVINTKDRIVSENFKGLDYLMNISQKNIKKEIPVPIKKINKILKEDNIIVKNEEEKNIISSLYNTICTAGNNIINNNLINKDMFKLQNSLERIDNSTRNNLEDYNVNGIKKGPPIRTIPQQQNNLQQSGYQPTNYAGGNFTKEEILRRFEFIQKQQNELYNLILNMQ